MRTLLSLLLAFVLALSFVGCASIQQESADPEASDLEESTAEASMSDEAAPLIKVGFAQVGHESGWRLASTASCQQVFSEENGYELLFIDCDQSPDAQMEAVEAFIQQQVDYIIIDPILSTGWTETLEHCDEADIPVIVIDRTIEDSDLYTAWVGSNFYTEGAASGEWLNAYAEAKGITELNILMIEGTEGASAQIGRTEGFLAAAEKYGWNILDAQFGDFTQIGGHEVMQSYCRTYEGQFNVVVCQNDDEALGALSAMEASNITCGEEGDVLVLSYDAGQKGLEAVMEGTIAADFECDPIAAPIVSKLIAAMEAGEAVEKKIYLEESWFAHDDTVSSFLLDGVSQTVTVPDEALLDGRW